LNLRRCFVLLLALAGWAHPATAQEITVVSAASYLPTIAPDSWASAFGSGLAARTTVAELDGDGQFPLEVDGVTVEVAGQPARIHFVSPGQVNFLVPSSLSPGLVTVVLRSAGMGRVFSGQVQLLTAAPALFSQDSSGAGPGAILNAVTFEAGPFQVETPEQTGDDKRTRLALFGTGFRFASELRAIVTIEDGRQFFLPLEYFGPAPGFFGLDQANLALPAELDCAGTVQVAVATPEFRSNDVAFEVTPLDASRIRLADLRLDANRVIGGNPVTGRVRTNGCAPADGFSVALRADHQVAQPPANVVIPSGLVEQDFLIETSVPVEQRSVEIEAEAGGIVRTVTLVVEAQSPVEVSSVLISPEVVLGGRSATGTVRLREAPASQVTVTLDSSSPQVAAVPEDVVFLAGQAEADFPITTTEVTGPVRVSIIASAPPTSAQGTLEVRPAVTLAVRPGEVVGGDPITLEVELAEPAPVGGANVALQSDSLAVVVPAFITVPLGQRVATEFVQTQPVAQDEEVHITARYQGVGATAAVMLRSPGSATLQSLELNPTTVSSGGVSTATVRLTAPAPVGGLQVFLGQQPPASVQMPTFVVVEAGQQAAFFTIRAPALVVSATTVTIEARLGQVRKTAELTLRP